MKCVERRGWLFVEIALATRLRYCSEELQFHKREHFSTTAPTTTTNELSTPILSPSSYSQSRDTQIFYGYFTANMTSTIGIPIKLLNEAQVRTNSTPRLLTRLLKSICCFRSTLLTSCAFQGHVVTLEITSGQVYRGKLIEGAFPMLT